MSLFWILAKTFSACRDWVLNTDKDFLSMPTLSFGLLLRISRYEPFLQRLCQHAETEFWTPAKTFLACWYVVLSPSKELHGMSQPVLYSQKDFVSMLRLSFELWQRLSQHVMIEFWAPSKNIMTCQNLFCILGKTFSACRDWVLNSC